MAALLGLGLAVAAEWPHFTQWTRGERAAFWGLWGITLAMVVATAWHVAPNLIWVQTHVFEPLGKRLLTPHADPYW